MWNYFIICLLETTSKYFFTKTKRTRLLLKINQDRGFKFLSGVLGHREWVVRKFLRLPVIEPLAIKNKQDYLQLFEDSKEDMVVEDGSATYLMNLDAPKLISQDNPNAKIIISLRNPIERTYTAYLAQYRTAKEKHSFGESIRRDLSSATGKELQNLRSLNSDYYEYVKNYYSYFPKEQIKIIIFEEFIKNPQQTTKEILHFLNLSADINFEYKQHNPVQISKNKISQSILTSKFFYYIGFALIPAKIRHYILRQFTTRTKPIMLEKDRDFLKEQYVDSVKKLESLLNRKIPWEI